MIFAKEDAVVESMRQSPQVAPWKVMIVDDQEDVHNVTRLVLEDFAFEGRGVECLSAFSGEEARRMLSERSDVAVVLLDVVMETKRTGLEVARFIREEIGNRFARIILRTGQPGEAPEHEVVAALDINDYRQKTELTADKLATALTTAIRSYRDLMTIDEGRRGLQLLAMSVAHQIRNRTTAIGGFANLIRKSDDASPKISEHLTTILHESKRLEDMVRDVTEFASVRMGELQSVSVRESLETSMELVEARGAALGQSVEWDVTCPDQSVRVDPNLFSLALTAILQNAVDFSEEEKRVRISVSPESLACAITVSDWGGGIKEEHMPFIFDPFFSVKPQGAGMGLCIARKAAMEHQWDLDVLNDPGHGVDVRIVIPRREFTGMRLGDG